MPLTLYKLSSQGHGSQRKPAVARAGRQHQGLPGHLGGGGGDGGGSGGGVGAFGPGCERGGQ